MTDLQHTQTDSDDYKGATSTIPEDVLVALLEIEAAVREFVTGWHPEAYPQLRGPLAKLDEARNG